MEVVLAAIRGAGGKAQISAYTVQKSLLQFFTEKKLFTPGVYADIPAVESWALKYGVALKKLVTFLAHRKMFLYSN